MKKPPLRRSGTSADDQDQPTFIPERTRELEVGEKIENGDLKWHQPAKEWTAIQTLGYRIVTASQKGLFLRQVKSQPEAVDGE